VDFERARFTYVFFLHNYDPSYDCTNVPSAILEDIKTFSEIFLGPWFIVNRDGGADDCSANSGFKKL